MPQVELLPVWTTSLLLTASPTFSVTATPLRTAVTEPVSFSTFPIICAEELGVVVCAYWLGAIEPASFSTSCDESVAPSG